MQNHLFRLYHEFCPTLYIGIRVGRAAAYYIFYESVVRSFINYNNAFFRICCLMIINLQSEFIEDAGIRVLAPLSNNLLTSSVYFPEAYVL